MAIVLLGDDYVPPSQTYYFRQEVWSHYNGSRLVPTIRSDVDADGTSEFPTRPVKITDPPPREGRTLVHATVAMVVEHTKPFALESPTLFTPLANPNPERFHRAYRFESLAQTIDYQLLAGRKAGDPAWTKEVFDYYTVPPSDPRFSELAKTIVAKLPVDKRDDPFLKAATVKLWMDEHLTYSTSHRHANVADPTADFLFGDKIGYCVHFAHAAVYLWRSLGIPARVGTGYAATADHRVGSSIMITGGDGHAWPELYLSGVGWIVLDISAHNNLDQPATPPDKDTQQQLAELLRDKPPQTSQDPETAGERLGRVKLPPLWTIIAVLAGAALLVLYAIKIWRMAAPLFAGQRDIPRIAYRYALDRLSELGYSRDYGETRERFARRVSHRFPVFVELTELHLAARFGDPAVAMAERPEHSKQHWRRGLKTLKQQIRSTTKTYLRVLSVLNPASFVASR